MSDVKVWAINCAEEIRTELENRTEMRDVNKDLFNRKVNLKIRRKENKASPDSEFGEQTILRKRIEYWDYLRNGYIYFQYQNGCIQQALDEMIDMIKRRDRKFINEKKKTD